MGFARWPPGEMFVDWCPVPSKVVVIEPGGLGWGIVRIPYLPRRRPVFVNGPSYPSPSDVVRIREVRLEPVAYTCEYGTVVAGYGWDGLTNTVYMTRGQYHRRP